MTPVRFRWRPVASLYCAWGESVWRLPLFCYRIRERAALEDKHFITKRGPAPLANVI